MKLYKNKSSSGQKVYFILYIKYILNIELEPHPSGGNEINFLHMEKLMM